MELKATIAFLENFKKRKGMYIDPVEYKIAENFLTGFRVGYFIATGIFDYEPWWESQSDRGWGRGAAGPIPKMIEKGLNSEQIIDELIEIEINTFEKYAKKYPDVLRE